MIKFRNVPMSQNYQDVERIENETILQAVNRCLETSDFSIEYVKVLIGGEIIEKEFWSSLTYGDSEIIVAIVPKGGEGREMWKTGIMLAVAIALTAATSGMASPVLAGVIVAGGTVVASMALNKLLPPITPGLGNLGGFSDYEQSQMYSLSGQSNAAKKFQAVPRVYGTHRVFPNVAAKPYFTFKSNGDGTQDSYLTAIYDFGIGPMYITDLKLGETPLGEFADVKFRFVDLNKPTVSTGIWDDQVTSSFSHYKGEVDQEEISYGINGNRDSGSPLGEYQTTRACTPSTGVSQEVSLVLAFPKGLYSVSNAGDYGSCTVTIEVQYRINGGSWINYADSNLDSLDVTGSNLTKDRTYSFLFTLRFVDKYPSTAPLYWSVLNTSFEYHTFREFNGFGQFYPGGTFYAMKRTMGFKAGTNYVIVWAAAVEFRQNPVIGMPIFVNGRNLGQCVSYDIMRYNQGVPDVWKVYLSAALDSDIHTYTEWVRYDATAAVMGEYVIKDIYQANIKTAGLVMKGSKQTAQFYTMTFTPNLIGDIDVRVTRINTVNQYTYQIMSDMTWYTLTTKTALPPIKTTKRHTFMEINIRATDQLNGSISNLSGVVTSAVPYWDTTTNSWKTKLSSNPAWAMADILTGQINKRKVGFDRLDTASLTEFASFCEQVPTGHPTKTYFFPRFQTNFILDFNSTVQSLIESVLSSAQAGLILNNGKYGVLIDKNKTIPVQVFTPRNYSSFSCTRTYSDPPHGLRIKYIDSATWEQAEVIAYSDGYNINNAEKIEDFDSFACTNDEQAWRYGRYLLAQDIYRRDTIQIEIDFENLICTRGDYVKITSDVMRVGGTPARVLSVSGTLVTIDEDLVTSVGKSYGYTFRRNSNGQILTSTLAQVSANSFNVLGAIPSVGDLLIHGEVGLITYECIVKSITPSDDLKASLVLVEKNNAIFDYEILGSFPPYNPLLTQIKDETLFPPPAVQNLVVTDNRWASNGSGYDYFIDLGWTYPINYPYDKFEIYANGDLVGYSNTPKYTYKVDLADLGTLHTFKVVAVSVYGSKLPLGNVPSVTATPTAKLTPPSNVDALYLNVTGEVLQLEWSYVLDGDIKEYLIRYSPNKNSIWETSTPLLKASRSMTMVSTQARTGAYFIKAIDFNGNESSNAAIGLTTIPELFNLNIIDTINDFPDLLGTYDRVVNHGGYLALKKKQSGGVDIEEYHEFGYYYFSRFLDLGDIYTVRLTNTVEAEGYNLKDFMATWDFLSNVPSLVTVGTSDWDVETQVRSTDGYNVIADWDNLAGVETLAAGMSEDWTPWRKLATVSDYTGRIFQFRLKLISNKASVSPKVVQGNIKADMPDRMDSYNNVTVPIGGLAIVYDTPFKGPANLNIQVTIDDGESGDYWTTTSKSLDGFTIQVFNKDNNPVSRQCDFMIRGYGRKTSRSI
jgi:hypothetical protein